MKYLIIVTSILFFSSCKSNKEFTIVYDEDMILNGQVRSLKITQYSVTNNAGQIELHKRGGPESTLAASWEWIFNESGMITNKNYYTWSDKLDEYKTYVFDKNLNEIIRTDYNNLGTATSTTNYFLNSAKQIQKKEHYVLLSNGEKKLGGTWIYDYDENGNKIRTKVSRMNSTLKDNEEIFKYDKFNHLIEDKNYIYTYVLDKNNAILEKHSNYKMSNQITEIAKYELDKNGNWKTETIFDSQGNETGYSEAEIIYY